MNQKRNGKPENQTKEVNPKNCIVSSRKSEEKSSRLYRNGNYRKTEGKEQRNNSFRQTASLPNKGPTSQRNVNGFRNGSGKIEGRQQQNTAPKQTITSVASKGSNRQRNCNCFPKESPTVRSVKSEEKSSKAARKTEGKEQRNYTFNQSTSNQRNRTGKIEGKQQQTNAVKQTTSASGKSEEKSSKESNGAAKKTEGKQQQQSNNTIQKTTTAPNKGPSNNQKEFNVFPKRIQNIIDNKSTKQQPTRKLPEQKQGSKNSPGRNVSEQNREYKKEQNTNKTANVPRKYLVQRTSVPPRQNVVNRNGSKDIKVIMPVKQSPRKPDKNEKRFGTFKNTHEVNRRKFPMQQPKKAASSGQKSANGNKKEISVNRQAIVFRQIEKNDDNQEVITRWLGLFKQSLNKVVAMNSSNESSKAISREQLQELEDQNRISMHTGLEISKIHANMNSCSCELDGDKRNVSNASISNQKLDENKKFDAEETHSMGEIEKDKDHSDLGLDQNARAYNSMVCNNFGLDKDKRNSSPKIASKHKLEQIDEDENENIDVEEIHLPEEEPLPQSATEEKYLFIEYKSSEAPKNCCDRDKKIHGKESLLILELTSKLEQIKENKLNDQEDVSSLKKSRESSKLPIASNDPREISPSKINKSKFGVYEEPPSKPIESDFANKYHYLAMDAATSVSSWQPSEPVLAAPTKLEPPENEEEMQDETVLDESEKGQNENSKNDKRDAPKKSGSLIASLFGFCKKTPPEG